MINLRRKGQLNYRLPLKCSWNFTSFRIHVHMCIHVISVSSVSMSEVYRDTYIDKWVKVKVQSRHEDMYV
jgi:hypothetical protein